MSPRRAAGCLVLPSHPVPGSRAPAPGEVGCKKGLKCGQGYSHSYPHPISHPFLKMNTDFLSYWKSIWCRQSSQKLPLRLYPPLSRLTKPLTVVATRLCHVTPRQQYPHRDLRAPPSFPAADNSWRTARVCTRHMNDTEDF